MIYRKFGQLDFEVSAVGLGTWITGGQSWGRVDDAASEKAIETSLESGVTLIDTAAVYGLGHSEELIGNVLQRLRARDKVILATKCGLEWDDQNRIHRNCTKRRILKEIDDSRRRLRTDVIDIYQIHWPDEATRFSETMETMLNLYAKGTIRGIGLSNFSVEQLEKCLHIGPVHAAQPAYNLFERDIESDLLPFCHERGIAVLSYSSICRGLLSGKFDSSTRFDSSDIRSRDPRFSKENFGKYLAAVDRLKPLAIAKKAALSQLAIQWAARQEGMTCALVGARNAEQAAANAGAFDFELSAEEMQEMESVIPYPHPCLD